MTEFSFSPYGTALMMGLAAGTTYCTAGCAPFLSTYVLGTGQRTMDGVRSYLFFILGKVCTYAFLGAISAMIGTTLSVKEGGISVDIAIGVVLVLVGLSLWWKPAERSHLGPRNKCCPERFLSRTACNSRIHLFFAGACLAAVPCPPVLGMLTYSLQSPSSFAGSIMMVLFGLGTAVSPLLIVAVAAGFFAEKIRARAPCSPLLFRRTAGSLAIVLGVNTVLFSQSM